MKSFRRSAVGLVLAVGAWTALAAPASAGASTVTQWNVNATNALIGTAAMAPPVSMVHMAMVHGAIYDAVNGIDRSHRPYLVLPAAQPWDSMDAAAATAAYRVLVEHRPGPAARARAAVRGVARRGSRRRRRRSAESRRAKRRRRR